jgi:hypothetical protein
MAPKSRTLDILIVEKVSKYGASVKPTMLGWLDEVLFLD